MTRNELKAQAKWAIIERLEEGYEGYLCDLHNEVFNTDMHKYFLIFCAIFLVDFA